jgi:heme oxygenase
MYLLHQELWRAIQRSRSKLPLLSQVVQDEGRHVANLRADLGALGVDGKVALALPATARAMAAISRTIRVQPLALLGYNYVLEGSMNGNRFIARALSRTLAVPALSYLDPYGDDQPAVWGAYRERMGAAGFDAEEMDHIVAAARTMFQSVAEMSDELWAEHNHPPAGLPREAGREPA